MSLKFKNIIITILSVIALIQILVVKDFLPDLYAVSQQTEEFCYDISLAFFTGALVYSFTSGWSSLILRKEQEKIIINEINAFLSYCLERLESIEKVDFSKGKDEVKKQFECLTYGSKAKSSASNTNTIYEILEKINTRKEKLYLSCIPMIQNSKNTKLLGKIYRLFNSEIFNGNCVYKKKDFGQIKNDSVGIGGFFFSYYQEVMTFKKLMKNNSI